MVDFAMTTPLQDENVTRTPLQILTDLLSEVSKRWLSHHSRIQLSNTKALCAYVYVTWISALHQSLCKYILRKGVSPVLRRSCDMKT